MTKVHQRLVSILEEFLEEKSMLNRAFSEPFTCINEDDSKDIKLLNDILEENGAKIESQRGTGYELEIIQAKKFEEFCVSLFQNRRKRSNFLRRKDSLHSTTYFNDRWVCEAFTVSRGDLCK